MRCYLLAIRLGNDLGVGFGRFLETVKQSLTCYAAPCSIFVDELRQHWDVIDRVSV